MSSVNLSAAHNGTFNGYLVVAQDENGERVGNFTLGVNQTHACNVSSGKYFNHMVLYSDQMIVTISISLISILA